MNTPNKITILRFILAFVAVLLLFPYQQFGINVPVIHCFPQGFEPVLGSIEGISASEISLLGFSVLDLIALVVFVTAAITDSIDGHIARKHNLITNFGKFMDPLADKFLVDGTLIMLCFRGFIDYSNGSYLSFGVMMPTLIVVLMIGRDLMVDGLKMLASSKGKVIAANVYGKAKTVAQMIVIPFYILNGFPFFYIFGVYTQYLMIALMTVVLILSWVSGIIYVYQGRDVLKENKNSNIESVEK